MHQADSVIYWLAIKRVPDYGPVTMRKEFGQHGSIEQVWQQIDLEQSAKTTLLEQAKDEWESCKQMGISIRTLDQIGYPASCKDLTDIDPVIYLKGQYDIDKSRRVAIVGSRKISSYGADVTAQFAAELSAAGCTIVSGMAMGVDTVAHQTALERDGATIAVWGSGLDQVFPASNVRLAERIEQQGLIVSQFPIGVPASKYTFPARNALIAALSEAVVVTEAHQDSGSLITAKYANKFGRQVWAVPGSIYHPGSQGTHQLISEGARLAVDAAAIVHSLGIQPGFSPALSPLDQTQLSASETAVLGVLSEMSQPIDQIIRQSKLTASQALTALTMLEINGWVIKSGDEYRLTRAWNLDTANHERE